MSDHEEMEFPEIQNAILKEVMEEAEQFIVSKMKENEEKNKDYDPESSTDATKELIATTGISIDDWLALTARAVASTKLEMMMGISMSHSVQMTLFTGILIGKGMAEKIRIDTDTIPEDW